jgi:hypothetical protein
VIDNHVAANEICPALATRHALSHHGTAAGQPPSSVSWRKLLLLRREVLCEQSKLFRELWHKFFPAHDMETLQFERPISKAEASWESESWKRAAGAYHAECRGRTLIVETDAKKIKRLRRLLDPSVSLERMWNELNDPQNRPTPQVTIEAIWLAVRERGVEALDQSATRSRYESCDASARAELRRRMGRAAC